MRKWQRSAKELLGESRNTVSIISTNGSTFREVFKAREKKSNKKFVAMKKVLMDHEKEGVCTSVCLILHRKMFLD